MDQITEPYVPGKTAAYYFITDLGVDFQYWAVVDTDHKKLSSANFCRVDTHCM